MIWIGGNENEMYAIGSPTDCEHDAGALVLTIIFFYFARSMYL